MPRSNINERVSECLGGVGVARTNERINITPKVLGISSMAEKSCFLITNAIV